MALPTQPSPGVPVSMEGEMELRSGTEPVKHFLERHRKLGSPYSSMGWRPKAALQLTQRCLPWLYLRRSMK